MKKIAIIMPTLLSVLALSGCSFIKNIFNSASRPSFSDKGEQTERERFVSDINEGLEKAGLEYRMNETHYSSFTGGYKAAGDSDEKAYRNGKTVKKYSTSAQYSSSIKYDSSHKAAQFKNEQKTNRTENSDSETISTKQEREATGHYQYDGDELVFTDEKTKKYSASAAYNSSVYEPEYRMDAALNGDLYQIISSFTSLTSETYESYCKYYENGHIYTIEYEQKYDVDYTIMSYKATVKAKFQMNLSGKKMTLKLTQTTSADYKYSTEYFSDYDSSSLYSDQYGTATIEFKSTSVKPVDLSGYRKI